MPKKNGSNWKNNPWKIIGKKCDISAVVKLQNAVQNACFVQNLIIAAKKNTIENGPIYVIFPVNNRYVHVFLS
jgi:hypothetical protein